VNAAVFLHNWNASTGRRGNPLFEDKKQEIEEAGRYLCREVGRC
jgi:hypothetical protein